jgi:hypothetical protein
LRRGGFEVISSAGVGDDEKSLISIRRCGAPADVGLVIERAWRVLPGHPRIKSPGAAITIACCGAQATESFNS